MNRWPAITPFVRNRLIFVAVCAAVVCAGAYAISGDVAYTAVAVAVVVGFWSLIALMHWSQVSQSPWPSFAMAAVLAAAGLGFAYAHWTHPNSGHLGWAGAIGAALAAVFPLRAGLKRRHAQASPSL